MKKAIAVAAFATSLTTSTAHATWFAANFNCMPLEDTYRAFQQPGMLAAPHTPTALVAQFHRYGIHDVTDVTARFPNADPNRIRVIDFGGLHGLHIFINDKAACYAGRAALANQDAQKAIGK